MITLRRYQNECVEKVRSCIRQIISCILMVLPTGGGKTVIFTYMAQRASERGNKTLILVHRIELLRQTSRALEKFEVDHGMINPLYTPNFSANTQVASVQTIVKRLAYFLAVNWIPDFIIVDEAHHATAGSWRKVIDHFKQFNPKLVVIGVTATPTRSDGQGLGKEAGGMFDEIVLGPPPKWMMEQGFLVKAKVLSPPKGFNREELPNKRGDYNPKELENLINKPTITGDAVLTYKEKCEQAGRRIPAIMFCVSVKHTEEVAQEFRNNGFKFYAIDGTTDDETRKSALDGLLDGSVDGVCSCDLINEGTDVPAAKYAGLLRPTKSLGLHLQQIGRVLRPVFAEGYDLETQEGRLLAILNSDYPEAYIADHVGNVGYLVDGLFVENHGLPEKEHVWGLEGEVKRKRGKKLDLSIKVQMCKSCFHVHEPAPVCPECGHVYEVKDNSPKKVEGQLQEITSEMTVKKLDPVKRGNQIELAKANTIEQLLDIAHLRGYSEGWAHVQFGLKEKKEAARLEKLQKKIDIAEQKKSQEIQFEEIEETEFVLEVLAGEFDDNLDF